MAACSSSHLLLWALILCLAVSTNSIVPEIPTIHVIDALPAGSEHLDLYCNGPAIGNEADRHRTVLFWGGELRFQPRLPYGVYYCGLSWERVFGDWHVYEPARDAGRSRLYWLIKEDGFYLSYDNKSWVIQGWWQTE